MKKNNTNKKTPRLQLSRQTLRRLDDGQLTAVAGGAIFTQTVSPTAKACGRP